MALLFPVMWLRRRLLRTSPQELSVVYDAEFKIIPVINDIAYEVFRQESHVIRRRRHMPMGTSLAVIARAR
jgi:hypothetical protein